METSGAQSTGQSHVLRFIHGIRWMVQCVSNKKIAYYGPLPDGISPRAGQSKSIFYADTKYAYLYSERPDQESLDAIAKENPQAVIQPIAFYYEPNLALAAPRNPNDMRDSTPADFIPEFGMQHHLMTP